MKEYLKKEYNNEYRYKKNVYYSNKNITEKIEEYSD